MHKTVVAFADKDKNFSESFLREALKKYPSSMSICLIDPSDGLLSAQGVANPTEKAAIDTANAFVKPGLLIAFGDNPPGSSDEDIQPWPILTDKDGNVLAYAFVTGSFPGSMKTGSSHPDTYEFANGFLKDHFQQLYDEVFEGDLAKLLQFCDKPMMRNTLLQGAVGESSIVIMFQDPGANNIKVYVKDLEPIEFAFGWTLDDCGYKENIGEYPPQDKAETKLPAALAKKAKKLIAGAVEAVVPPKPDITKRVAEVVPIKPTVTKTDTAPVAVPPQNLGLPHGVTLGEDGVVYGQPPANMHDKRVKRFFHNVVGFLPNNPKGQWQSRPCVPLTDSKVADLCRANPWLKAAIDAKKGKAGKDTGTPKPVQAAAAPKADAKPAAQSQPSSGTVPAAAQTGVPDVTNKVLEGFMPVAKRYIDPLSNEVPDPTKLQAQEERCLTYAKSLGIEGVHNTILWPEEALKLLGQKSIEALVDLAMDYRLMWLRHHTHEELRRMVQPPEKSAAKLPAALANRKGKIAM